MAIYENKFEIGDEVFTKDNEHEYPRYKDMANLLFATNFCESLQQAKCKVISYGIHPRNHDFIYLVEDENQHQHLFGEVGLELYNGQDKELSNEEEYLAQQTPKQKYKPRVKWVKNTGEKPDLPDSTLVKIVWDGGNKEACTVGQYNWNIEFEGDDIVKWKLADDWNKVIDGQAPDIDGATLIDIKWVDGEVFKNYPMRTVVGWYDIKKWRYAKEKKAK